MLRLSLPCLQHQEGGDRSESPALKSIVGLDSMATMDQGVFQLTFLAQLVQILLTAPSHSGGESALQFQCRMK